MPNLYKGYFLQGSFGERKVINPNTLLEERKLKRPSICVPAEGIFSSDFFSDAPVIKEEPEEELTVDDAKEEADRILDEAKEMAEQVIEQANLEADGIREDARAQGYREGTEQSRIELESLRQDLEQKYNEKDQDLQAAYEQKLDSMESDLIDAVTEVFNKVFHVQFDGKKEILMHLVKDTIYHVEGEREFRVRTSGSNADYLEEHREEIVMFVGQGVTIEFIPDPAMGENECRIETDSGIFDCGTDTQLENLMRDIRSLCS